MRPVLFGVAAAGLVQVVRRSVDEAGETLLLGSEFVTDESTKGLLEECMRLAEEHLDAPFAKNLGGAGSGGVVFSTTTGTVVKCGTGNNLKLEGDALLTLQAVDGVVNLLRMVEKEGYFLLELEFLTAMTWKECIGSGGCVTPEGDECDQGQERECFPACKADWGNGPAFLETPLNYAQARDLIEANIRAFHNVCKASFSQADSTSGMNTMVTSEGEIKLIDFEKGHELGHWHGGLWCNKDQQTMQARISEVTRCLAPEDPFRAAAEQIGGSLKGWSSSPGQALWKKGDEEKIVAAQQADIAQATGIVEATIAKLHERPFP